METQFYILLSIKTLRGFEAYGQYFLGNDREAATDLFAQLKGNQDIHDPLLLHVDLMETIDEIPSQIKTICCTLDELSYNIKLITKQIFRLKNLKEIR